MLIENANNSEFMEECESEKRLLKVTQSLLQEDLVVWQLPCIQIRCDEKNGIVLKRVL